MGGPGSGDWYRWDTTSKMEDCRRLDIRQLRQKRCLRPGMYYSWHWSRGDEPSGDIRIEVRDSCTILRYRYREAGGEWMDIEEFVSIAWTPCNYGGSRPWFICPRCGRRVCVLVGAGPRFLCRHCYCLRYASQCETRVDRMQRKVRKIRARLGGEGWRKPKGMHEKTFKRLREKLRDAEMEENEAFLVRLARFFIRNH